MLPMMMSSPPRPSNLVQADRHTGHAADACKPRGIEGIGEVAADDAFDVDQRVAADAGAADRAGRQIDRDGAGGIGVDRPVKARAAVEQVVVGQALQPVVAAKALDGVVAAVPISVSGPAVPTTVAPR